jgi:uncharacterized protein YbcC (UPF0753/DUF2309 family)
MSNCSNHKKDIAGITDMKVLAEMIGDLHYESLAELMNHLASKFHEDYFRDFEAGKLEVAKGLLWIYHAMHKASYGAEIVWKISKPFMKENPNTENK